jgi:DNA-directed RNA polymerase subunit M/transcription elongation factor TFIIS
LFTGCVVVVFQEAADNFCVYRNEIHHSVAERTQVLQDVAADPTLPRTKAVRCVQCNHGEAVFFQVKSPFYGTQELLLFSFCIYVIQIFRGKRSCSCSLDFDFELDC